MRILFVLEHGLSDEPIEVTRECQCVPREGETIITALGPDETAFVVEQVQHVVNDSHEIIVHATDMQRQFSAQKEG